VTSFKRLVDALVRARSHAFSVLLLLPAASTALFRQRLTPARARQGTPKDTRELRGRLHRQRDALGQIAKDTTAAVKLLSELASLPDAAPSAKATQTKLVKDFQAVLKEFQKAQRSCAERESAHLPQAEPSSRQLMPPGQAAAAAGLAGRFAASGATSSQLPPFEAEGSYQRSESLEQQALLKEHKRQELLLLDGEIEYNSALIAERDAGIAEIQSQIGEVNEIFQDLAVLVNEQGGLIDDIEANIVRTSVRTKEAKRELQKAEVSQKGSQRWMMYLMLIVGIGLVVAVLAFTLR
jgi:syntaxin 7